MSPLCVVREVLSTLRTSFLAGEWTRVSGHAFVEQPQEPDQACCVRVLRCDVCGHYDVSWDSCVCKARRAAVQQTAPQVKP